MFTTTVKQLPPLHWQITWWSFFCLCKIRFLPLWHWKARKVIPCSKAYLGYHETYIHLWWSCVLGGFLRKYLPALSAKVESSPKIPPALPPPKKSSIMNLRVQRCISTICPLPDTCIQYSFIQFCSALCSQKKPSSSIVKKFKKYTLWQYTLCGTFSVALTNHKWELFACETYFTKEKKSNNLGYRNIQNPVIDLLANGVTPE